MQEIKKLISVCNDCCCKPVLLFTNATKKAKIMIITEQPNAHFMLEDLNKCYKEWEKYCNRKERNDYEKCEEKIKSNCCIRRWEKKNSSPWRINKLLNKRFFNGLEVGLIYWTHFVKCPRAKLDGYCAKKHLNKEIEYFAEKELKYVIAFGKSGLYVYNEIIKTQEQEKAKNITDVINRMIKEKKNDYKIKIFNKKVIFFPLFHPSGRNPSANKIKNIDEYDKYKKEVEKIFKERLY
ncbi:MAG: hypothetical protein PHE88_02360 [Elusimicrobia bacterium]|nr:hypothetical protein [Elusimicrobiota bacterium]